MTIAPKLTRKDFQSDQEIRWCPGCGDYSIVAQVQKVLPELGVPRENVVFVSGIGCSSRFPYYMNTYGFHTIHGRATAIASGLKLARPDLQVWVVTGDGDALAIGGNHLIHSLRRNADIKILLFNNRIYGLTKGQASPTSELDKKAKSTPYGTIDRPFNPVQMALASGATFVARTIDTEPSHLQQIITRAAQHKGAAFVEILQNCVVFNDGAFEDLSAKTTKDDTTVRLEPGKPLTFSKGQRGVRMNGFRPEVIDLAGAEEPLVWSETEPIALAVALGELTAPTPLGVFRAVEKPTHDQLDRAQAQAVVQKKGQGDLGKLLLGTDSWTVK